MKTKMRCLILTGIWSGAWLFGAAPTFAHCDTLEGPVVSAARTALEKKDITPVLKWIQTQQEPELKSAFARTLRVRAQGNEARELADQFFFETLVRLHRAGEGAPYTGLKPAGTKPEPAVEAGDAALETGTADAVVKLVTDAAAGGIRKRLADVVEKKRHAEDSVEAGREYVAAYVEFVHYVEALHAAATREAQAHGHGEAAVHSAKATHEHNQ